MLSPVSLVFQSFVQNLCYFKFLCNVKRLAYNHVTDDCDCAIFIPWSSSPQSAKASSLSMLHDHTDTLHSVRLLWTQRKKLSSSSLPSCSGRIRFDSCCLYPQNETGPSISSSVVLCVFVLLVYIVVLV